MNENGTTVEDNTHELLVYKVSAMQIVLLNSVCNVSVEDSIV